MVALIIGGLRLFIVVLTATRTPLESNADLLSRHFVSIDCERFLYGHKVELIASPGADAHVAAYAAESIQKHWNSDHLQFIVQDLATSRQLAHMDLSRVDNWEKVTSPDRLGVILGEGWPILTMGGGGAG